MEAVAEVEQKRDHDDRDDVVDHELRVLQRDALEHVRDVLALIERALERVVQLLPLDHFQRIRSVPAKSAPTAW